MPRRPCKQCPGSASGPWPWEQASQPPCLPPLRWEDRLVQSGRPGWCQRQCLGGKGATRLGSLEGLSEALSCPPRVGTVAELEQGPLEFRGL